jgi:hypothetical protein
MDGLVLQAQAGAEQGGVAVIHPLAAWSPHLPDLPEAPGPLEG